MKKNDRFKMSAYTGPVLKNPFWGRFTIDIDGMRLPNGKMPALREHDRFRPTGVIDKKLKDIKALMAEGYFLNTPDGVECRALISEGFPMQASIGVNFEQIEKIAKNETAIVNGDNFIGPGVIARKSYVREISFVSLGADDNTSISNLKESGIMRSEIQNENSPEDFGAALSLVLNEGKLELWDAIEETAKRFPKLFEAYEAEVRVLPLDDNV
jgi:hypothetical protein